MLLLLLTRSQNFKMLLEISDKFAFCFLCHQIFRSSRSIVNEALGHRSRGSMSNLPLLQSFMGKRDNLGIIFYITPLKCIL